MTEHPMPWAVNYFKRFPEWDERSCPCVVDANGSVVCILPQTVDHPGMYDALADATAKRIVVAVNDHE